MSIINKQDIVKFLSDTINDHKQDLLPSTVTNSLPTSGTKFQRTMADTIELSISDLLLSLDIADFKFKEAKSNRSIEDVLMEVGEDTYYLDVKTDNEDKTFSMPNLISVERLYKLYQDDNSHIIYIFITYNNNAEITGVNVMRIEELSPSILRHGNLGVGQLQLANNKAKKVSYEGSRESWMKWLVNATITFKYNQEIKIKKEIGKWENRYDYVL